MRAWRWDRDHRIGHAAVLSMAAQHAVKRRSSTRRTSGHIEQHHPGRGLDAHAIRVQKQRLAADQFRGGDHLAALVSRSTAAGHRHLRSSPPCAYSLKTRGDHTQRAFGAENHCFRS